MTKKNKKVSSYSSRNKKPHKYSELYYSWRAARLANKSDLAVQLAEEHSKRFLNKGDEMEVWY